MSDRLNPFAAPQTDFEGRVSYENTSGRGKGHPIPDGVKGWSWGAFILSWIWAIGNGTWIGLLGIIPYVSFIVRIWLGLKGRELAWQNKAWDSVEHFNDTQRRWSMWGVILLGGVVGIGIVSALGIYGVRHYIETHR
jgi:hypothetical protein